MSRSIGQLGVPRRFPKDERLDQHSSGRLVTNGFASRAPGRACFWYTRGFLLFQSRGDPIQVSKQFLPNIVSVLRYLTFLTISIIICNSICSYLTKYVYPLAMMAQTSSIWILIVITVERFIAVYFPLQAKFICTPTITTVALALTILTAVVYNFVRFWEYKLEWDANSAVYLVELLRKDEEYLRVYVLWLYLITQFIYPFASLVVLNGLIVFKIRVAKAYRETLSRQQTKEYKTANMMVMVIVIFILCNTLAFCLNVLETIQGGRLKQQNWFFLCTDVNNLLVECNSACNCVVYYKYSLRYRLAVKKCLRRSNSHDIAYHAVALAQVSTSNCCD